MNETLGLVTIFVPLFLIVWIANAAEARRQREEPFEGVAIVAYVSIVLLYLLGLCGGLLLQFGSVLAENDPSILQGMMTGDSLESLPLLAFGLWLPSLLGIIFLLPAARRLFARFTPIDPQSPVHAIALSLSMLVLINLFMTLGIGLGNLADMMATVEEETAGGQDNTLLTLWLQQILTAMLAVVGVGWLSRRSWGGAFARLGLVAPTGRQWLIGVGAGLAMVPLVLLIEYISSLFGLGASADVERLTEELLGSLFTTPFGILTLGLAAALGEETLFRGAITPRFGLILSSLLFALVHSNYGITLSTLVVFLLGMLLGWLRLRYNTSTAMLTHAVYNMSLGLLAYLNIHNLDI
jgi:membrane protease YdiL (CAAX protease family)